MGRKTAHVLTVGLILAGGTHELRADNQAPDVCAAREMVPAQIRLLNGRTVPIVANGMMRSATLRRVIDRVGDLNGIVYTEDRYYVNGQTRRVLSGALSHQITKAGTYRILHVMVAPESGDRRLLTMAHELQHAIEVLEAPGVATEAAVDDLFERIGTHTSAGVVETEAAFAIERAVARELLASRELGDASISARSDAGPIGSRKRPKNSLSPDAVPDSTITPLFNCTGILGQSK
jgi:hypothetical protein